ncbi:MAG: hypothetical protein M1822_006277 [Bathelium mastoideum]|nr:MAG: hypothetical protein M1822_006277 [Bathelium mastoideum]
MFQQPPRTEYSSYTTASNDDSRVQQYNMTESLPAFQITPSVEDEYLERQQQQTNEQLLQHRLRATETPTYHNNEPLNRMVRKREHARAVSNTTPPRVSGPQDLPDLAEPPEPPASAPPASPAYGVNPSRGPPPPHLDLDRERRRAVGNPLAWRVASYSPRADRRRESNELAAAAAPLSPPSGPPSPPSPPPPQANGRWVYRYGEMQELMDYYKESTKRLGSHVSPAKRDGNKPWLTKNWREPRQDDQDGSNAQ